MKEKRKKPAEKNFEQSPIDESKLSPSRKRVFWLITISIPFLFLFLLEAGLRIFNYGGNIDLFIEGPEGYEEYIRCNPEVARRYFDIQTNIPTPPKQLFLKHKPKNCYRIFVLGESSAAGFPFGNNVSFPNILERGLKYTFPKKKIEVVNVAMAAINSYTLLDFIDEILEQSPELILIYTGHNEYYGALGVGSIQSVGNSRWLVNTYLKMRSVKTFLMLRDFIGWMKIKMNDLFYGGSEINPSATLMERIVGEQTIPYGSSLYEEGKEQFNANMDELFKKVSEKKVKIMVGELVSNVKDQEPFISVRDKSGKSSKDYFSAGRKYETDGNFEMAKENYYKAKDNDALRFRASEDFNDIIHNLGEKYNAVVVPSKLYFENNSINGLIGYNLMFEHLHPNAEGYFLLAKAFYESMRSNHLIEQNWLNDGISKTYKEGYTELDSVHASLVIRHLKSGWPFIPKNISNQFIEKFIPHNIIEETAIRVLKEANFSIEVAHMTLGEYYESVGNLEKAYQEYKALITSIPHEMEFYRKAASILIKRKKFDEAWQVLSSSLQYKENQFAFKWLGQISLMRKDFKNSILYLNKADLADNQVLFNLARAYYSDNQWNRGEELYTKLKSVAPQSEYTIYLSKMRNQPLVKN